jgi:hypothetical protein
MSSLFSSGNDSYTRIRGAVHRQRGRSPILSASHLTGRSVHTKAEAFAISLQSVLIPVVFLRGPRKTRAVCVFRWR